jgi:hypothetical protein
LLGALLALAGCGGDHGDEAHAPLGAPRLYPVPGCEAFDPAPCDVETAACQRRLFGLAACLRGSDAGELPPISVMSEANYQAYLEAARANQEPTPNLDRWEAAFVLLGLIAPGGLEDDAEVQNAVNFVWGFYDYDTKQVNLVDHGADSNAETSSAVLLHEFVHVLQDREVDLASYRSLHGMTYDTGLASDSIIEGEAQFHEERYLASMLGFNPTDIDWSLLFENGVADGEQNLFQQSSVLTAAWNIFPYDWGARYVQFAWDAKGHPGVLDLFAEPPANTQREMASSSGIAEDVAGADISSPLPPDPWQLVGEDSLGAFGAFELLGLNAGISKARLLVLDWRADRLAVYAGSDADGISATVVVWLCDFASEASAQSAATLLAGTSDANVARATGQRVIVARTDGNVSLDWTVASP